ncbi:hypothetical protein J6590_023709 [Homalodisca vitripennis]|nr:hypothetical protein J6590_023709 [Homalodisca vitripennis]
MYLARWNFTSENVTRDGATETNQRAARLLVGVVRMVGLYANLRRRHHYADPGVSIQDIVKAVGKIDSISSVDSQEIQVNVSALDPIKTIKL